MPEVSRILFIGLRWPEPEATAAGRRLLQLMEVFRDDGREIHFATASKPGKYPADLSKAGVQTHMLRLNHASADAFFREYAFDAVVFDRFQTEEQFGWRIREQLPDCLLILDTEDVHSLRDSRGKAVAEGKPWTRSLWMANPLFGRELASILRCDVSLIISKAEVSLLSDLFPWLAPVLVYMPFQVSLPLSWGAKDFSDRRDFVFVGNGKHAPNADAMHLLVGDVWPHLRKACPEASLHIYGAYLPASVRAAHRPKQGVFIRGWAEDLQSVMESARVQLAPLRFGAGIKGKILEAVCHGLPTLTTTTGSEGIYTDASPEALEAEPGAAFVEKAKTLYTDAAVWQAARNEARLRARDHFQGGRDLKPALKRVWDARTYYPEGQAWVLRTLLRDRAFGATRYMSRWIEAKTKR